MRILGVIPARAGSKRIPHKNTQRVGGKSLIQWAVTHAVEAHLLDHWVLSTDIHDLGIWLPVAQHLIHRPEELAQDDTPMAPVLLHAAEATGGNWDAVVTIQPTSPLRTARDIDRCIAMGIDCRNSYEYSGVVSINEATGKRNGAVYFTPMDALKRGIVFSDRCHEWDGSAHKMPPERSLDINTPEDLEEARRILGA